MLIKIKPSAIPKYKDACNLIGKFGSLHKVVRETVDLYYASGEYIEKGDCIIFDSKNKEGISE